MYLTGIPVGEISGNAKREGVFLIVHAKAVLNKQRSGLTFKKIVFWIESGTLFLYAILATCPKRASALT